jgi:hypothetical protein
MNEGLLFLLHFASKFLFCLEHFVELQLELIDRDELSLALHSLNYTLK